MDEDQKPAAETIEEALSIMPDERILISEIDVGERHRKDFGDLEALAKSIKEEGLLQPLGVTSANELVFGERRLRACRDILGWPTIPVRIVNVESIIDGEITENTMRKNFTVSELVGIVNTMRNFSHGGDRRSGQVLTSDVETLTVDAAAKRVGLGNKDTYYRAVKVIENGVADLIEKMDAGEISIAAAAAIVVEATPEEQAQCLAEPINEKRITTKSVKKTVKKIRKEKAVQEADKISVKPQNSEDPVQVFHCRLQDLPEVAAIKSLSVNLICTDIPDDGDFLPELNDLAIMAKQILIPGGTLACYLGQYALDEKLECLGRHLTYRWMGVSAWHGAGNPVPLMKVVSQNVVWAVFSRGEWKPPHQWLDTFLDTPQEKNWHDWQRPLSEVEQFIEWFSDENDLVVDPCAGSFTTAIACQRLRRRFIGCDVDRTAVVRGQQRIAEATASVESVPCAS